MKRSVILLIWLCILVGCKQPTQPAPPAAQPDPALAAQAFYDARPEYERPLAFTAVPEGLASMEAEACGACHKAIYDEWAVSTHRRAWLGDVQFQEELKKSRGAHDPKAGDVGWLCVNCHTPLAAQQDQWVVGLKDGQINRPIYVQNPQFDEAFQEDAITCAGCHVRGGVVYGPYGDTQAPHPVKKGDYLLDERVCVRCHQAEARYPTQNLGCFFTTGAEWAASPAAAEGKTCQSCHMPEIERHVADSFVDRPKRKTRRHWFGGSLIPKQPQWEAEIAPLREVFGSAVSVALVRIERVDGVARAVVAVTNDRAGHSFPTGDPERHAEIVVRVKDAGGEVVGEARDHIGTRYQWWPEIKRLTDTRVGAGQTREIAVQVPEAASVGALTVEIEGHKWRMYEEAFAHHELEGKAVRGRLFHRSSWSARVGEAPRQLSLVDDLHPAPADK